MFSEFLIPLLVEKWKFSITLLITLIITICSYLRVVFKRNWPPGPAGLPLVGYLPFLGSQAHRTLHKLSETYGAIFSIHLGRKLIIVLNNFESAKEALLNNSILDRPKNPPNQLSPGGTNLTICNGKVWNEQRKYSMQMLRELRKPNDSMEKHIQIEIEKLLRKIESADEKSLDLDSLLYPSVANNMLNLLIGRTLDDNGDKKDSYLLSTFLRNVKFFLKPTAIHAYFPWIKYWMIKLKIRNYDFVNNYVNCFEQFLEKEIQDHKKNFNTSNVNDYIDGYLQTLYSKNCISSSFSEAMLKGNVTTLFVAGSNPTRAALQWSLFAIIMYPEVQRGVQKEVDSVLGNKRCPEWADHSDMPYTMAVIYESLRYYTVVPINMLRSASTKTKIGKYDIPKDAIVLINLWAIHHDPQYWEDPFTFKPERFIRNGRVVRRKSFIPFSYGKRNCPGEDIAIMEIFLYFSTLLQHYRIISPCRYHSFKQESGAALHVSLDNVTLIRR